MFKINAQYFIYVVQNIYFPLKKLMNVDLCNYKEIYLDFLSHIRIVSNFHEIETNKHSFEFNFFHIVK